MECQAKDCTREPDDEMGLFCVEHWKLVPAPMRDQLFNRYKKDVDRQSKEWIEIARRAVGAVLAAEHQLKRPGKEQV